MDDDTGRPAPPAGGLYLRRCTRCGNFHNWSLLPDGTAVCGDCGTEHPPRGGRPEARVAPDG